MGVHSTGGHRANFLVRIPSWLQVNASEQFSVYTVVGVRNVPMVFFERQHLKRDEFGYRKFISCQEDCLPRGAVADCKNCFRTGRAHFFCCHTVCNVRGLRLLNFDLQFANSLLLFCNDLFIVGYLMADQFADSFFARRGAIRWNDFAIRLLGHANLLEFKNGAGAIPILFETQSGLLSC